MNDYTAVGNRERSPGFEAAPAPAPFLVSEVPWNTDLAFTLRAADAFGNLIFESPGGGRGGGGSKSNVSFSKFNLGAEDRSGGDIARVKLAKLAGGCEPLEPSATQS